MDPTHPPNVTALRKYERLEAVGRWRPACGTPAIEVIVTMGKTSLTLIDKGESPLAHWSLAALNRANPGQFPAVFHPHGNPHETLEIDAGESTMLDGIATLQRSLGDRPPLQSRPSRRWMLIALTGLMMAAVAVWFLPRVMLDVAVHIAPKERRAGIDTELVAATERLAGPVCNDRAGAEVLARLSAHVFAPDTTAHIKLSVMRGGALSIARLPGGRILIHRRVIEQAAGPQVLAGYMLIAAYLPPEGDALAALLSQAGLWATVHFLVSGQLPQATLAAHASRVLTTPTTSSTLLAAGRKGVVAGAFARAGISPTPFVAAIDHGQTHFADLAPHAHLVNESASLPISAEDWQKLQRICDQEDERTKVR